MKQTFEPGQTVYLPDGRKAMYVARLDNHWVKEVLRGFDPEEGYFNYHSAPFPVPLVLEHEPSEDEKRAAKIKKLRAELAELEGKT